MDRFCFNLGVSPSFLNIVGMLTLYSNTIIYEIASQCKTFTQTRVITTDGRSSCLDHVGELRKQ